ncbi:MAG: hypothetical protein HOU81_16460 [Hamadaea sp.]|uniref:hypothetical protein n=1 Tax=Hamadaea sp. TaxID=2024425 RepID=UPI0017E6A6C6|nr:hypothetical protein [Hamadaea sp.]NUR72409.1 hypothetical protein [Hamadaea sp.]NUT22705.1 hypothetical protein [Hamadaea sp.]
MTQQDEWRGTLNQILYLTNYARALNDEDAARFATQMIEFDFFPDGPAVYRAAIDRALAAPVLLDEGAVPAPHPEPALREFLGKVAAELDARQPWASPRYRMLDAKLWETFGQARAIAKIDWSPIRVANHLRSLFDTVQAGEAKLPVLVFRIGSGEVLAFLGSADPKVHSVTLYQRDPGDPAEIIAHFCEYTGFDPAEIKPLHG